jgi:hypothetical protein
VTLTCPTCEAPCAGDDAKAARVALARHLMGTHQASQGEAVSTAYEAYVQQSEGWDEASLGSGRAPSFQAPPPEKPAPIEKDPEPVEVKAGRRPHRRRTMGVESQELIVREEREAKAAGRPRVDVDAKEARALHDAKRSWTSVAKELGVHRNTLGRRGLSVKKTAKRKCVDCPATFVPTGNRQVRCVECGKKAKIRSAAKRRSGVENGGARKGPFMEEIRKKLATRAHLVRQIAAIDGELAEVGRALKDVTPLVGRVKRV